MWHRLLLIVALIVAGVLASQWHQRREARSPEALGRMVEDINKRLPERALADVMFLGAAPGEGAVVYTVRFERLNENQMRPEDVAMVRSTVERLLCADAAATKAREAGITLRANAVDRTGTPITSVAVLPGGC